jgi:hypothetical protein
MTILVGGAAFAAMAASLMVRPGWTKELPAVLVWLAVAGGAIALALGDAAPTGWRPLDALCRAGVGAVVVLAATRRGLGWTLWLTGVVAVGLVLGDAGSWESLGAAGLATAAALAVTGERSAVLQGAAAAAALAPLAQLRWPLVTGASAALATVALVPLTWASVRIAPRRVRRSLPWALVAIVLVMGLGAVVGAMSAFAAREDVDRAVDEAVAGLDQLDADDPVPTLEKLRAASESFDAAESTLRAWWARPALLVPGVAQQARAVATMADSGGELARAAATSLDEVDLDTLKPTAGRIDLARVEGVRGPVDRALASLQSADRRLAEVRSPLLVGLVADRLDELAAKVDDALATAENASAALDAAPDLLGGDGPRRYFLVMQTPSELRGAGGFMGSWGVLVADDGDLVLERTGRVRELTEGGADPAGRRIEGPPEFVDHWTQTPAQYWGLIGFTPDFPTVGAIVAQLYPESGGTEVDGVISLDPAGFAALLQLTGPITVPGRADALTPENAEQVLLHQQYLDAASGDDAQREVFLEDATRTLFERLTSGDLPGPQTMSDALAPMVDGRHIQLYAVRDAEQRFFERIGADGSVRRTTADAVGIVGQNYNGNKIDYFLRRTLSYDVTWDPESGRIDGELTVQLENLAPSTGLPHSVIGWGGDLSANQLPVADGENLHYLSLYTAGRLSDITVDQAPAEVNRYVADLGYEAQDLYVTIPSQGVVVIHAIVSSQVPPGRRYEMEVLRQSTATPDQVHVRMRVADGWRLQDVQGATVDGGVVVLDGDSSVPLRVSAAVEPVDRSWLDRLRGRSAERGG